MSKLEFFWDVASPYTYFAASQIQDLAERNQAQLVYRPFLIGGVFKASGNVMPGANPYKAKYMLADLARWRAHYDLPFRLPAKEVTFPINSLLPMRVATALQSEGRDGDFCHAVMKAYWEQGKDVSLEDEVKVVLQDMGLDPGPVVDEAGSQEVKDKLRSTTAEAAERGAFGAPTFFIGEEMFWGNDRLEFLEQKLRTA